MKHSGIFYMRVAGGAISSTHLSIYCFVILYVLYGWDFLLTSVKSRQVCKRKADGCLNVLWLDHFITIPQIWLLKVHSILPSSNKGTRDYTLQKVLHTNWQISVLQLEKTLTHILDKKKLKRKSFLGQFGQNPAKSLTSNWQTPNPQKSWHILGRLFGGMLDSAV